MNIVELERTLWATADKLRANMDTDEGFLCAFSSQNNLKM
jgi:hypothetical protein